MSHDIQFVLDIETTALTSNMGSIVEVGVVKYVRETGEITPVYHALVKENMGIDEKAWIFSNSNLTPAEVSQYGLPIEKVVSDLNELLKDSPVTAFNKAFDFGWLRSRGVNIPKESPCIMKEITTPILQLKNAKNGKTKWPNVPECLSYYKIDAIEPHRALGDALLEATILRCTDNIAHYMNRVDWTFNACYSEALSIPPKMEKIWLHKAYEPIPVEKTAKQQANTPELKVLRWGTKIKFYEDLTEGIKLLVAEKVKNMEAYLATEPSDDGQFIIDTIMESGQNTLTHIAEKMDYCKKELSKLSAI